MSLPNPTGSYTRPRRCFRSSHRRMSGSALRPFTASRRMKSRTLGRRRRCRRPAPLSVGSMKSGGASARGAQLPAFLAAFSPAPASAAHLLCGSLLPALLLCCLLCCFAGAGAALRRQACGGDWRGGGVVPRGERVDAAPHARGAAGPLPLLSRPCGDRAVDPETFVRLLDEPQKSKRPRCPRTMPRGCL